MKPAVKNLLIGTGIALAFFSFAVYDSVTTALTVFEKIGIKPISLPKKISFSNPNDLGIPQNISFAIDIKIENPDFREFAVSGYGVASLKQVDIYFKDFHLGTANLELEEITVPAQSSLIIEDVPFVGNTLSVLQNATAFSNLSLSDLRFTGIIEALGTQYQIG